MSLVLCKMSYLLLAFISIPILFELHSILLFWLDEVPKYVEIICIGLIFSLLTNQLTIGLDVAVHAIGNIKHYMLTAGILRVVLVPIAYVLLMFNYGVLYIMIAYIITDIVTGFLRYRIFLNLIKLESVQFVPKVLIPIALPSLITIAFMYVSVNYITVEYRFVFTVILGVFVFIVSSALLSFTKNEKAKVFEKIKSLYNKNKT